MRTSPRSRQGSAGSTEMARHSGKRAAGKGDIWWRAGKNAKRQEIIHAFPTDWRASRLRRAVIEQAKLEEMEAEIEETYA